MHEEVIAKLESAFASVPPPDESDQGLSSNECHRLIGDLLLLWPEHLQWILPRILIDLLRFPSRPNASHDLEEIVAELNVRREHWGSSAETDKSYYANHPEMIPPDDWDDGMEHVRQNRKEAYELFTHEQALAILAFLDAIHDRSSTALLQKFWEQNWEAAYRYWQER